jgi:hypothetical protein
MTLARGKPIAGQIVNSMAEKSAKKKTKKAAKADPGVLGNLSSTRPTRIGGERRGATSSARPAAAKPAAAKATATKSSPKRAAAKPAKPKAKPAPKKPATTAAPPAGWQTPGDGDERRDGGRTELVTTAVQAAGELAQMGLTVGGQILKRAANRIPGR